MDFVYITLRNIVYPEPNGVLYADCASNVVFLTADHNEWGIAVDLQLFVPFNNLSRRTNPLEAIEPELTKYRHVTAALPVDSPGLADIINCELDPVWHSVVLVYTNGKPERFSINWARTCFPIEGDTSPSVRNLMSYNYKVSTDPINANDFRSSLQYHMVPEGCCEVLDNVPDFFVEYSRCEREIGSGTGHSWEITSTIQTDERYKVIRGRYTVLLLMQKAGRVPLRRLYPADRIHDSLTVTGTQWCKRAVFRWPFILEKVVEFCLAIQFFLPPYCVLWIFDHYPHSLLTPHKKRIGDIEHLFQTYRKLIYAPDSDAHKHRRLIADSPTTAQTD